LIFFDFFFQQGGIMRFYLIIFLFCTISLSAIDLNLPLSAAQNATAGLTLLYSTPAAVAQNPASGQNGVETSATHLFGMQELPYYNVHACYRFRNFHIHLGESYLDHKYYTESCTSLSLGYTWQEVSAGIGVRLLRNEVTGYHDGSASLIDAGLKWDNDRISTALAIHNVMQSEFLELSLPIVILWESCYRITEKSSFAIGMEKEDDFDFSFKFAGKYQPFSVMSILAGYQFEPDRLGIGTVFEVKKFFVCYSVRTHQYLDLTHYISVGYEIKN